MINIYKVYKGIYQRWYQNPHVNDYKKMKEIAHEILEGDKSRKQLLNIAKRLNKIERNLYVRVSFSERWRRAVESGDYYLEIPYEIQHKYNDNNYGLIYIFESGIRPGEVKLGATTLDIDKRISKYEYKYGYNVTCFYHEWVRLPFKLEEKIKMELKDFRVDTNIEGDSNEWYFISPKKLKALIVKNIKSMHKSLSKNN